MEKKPLIFILSVLLTTFSYGQGLLNKLKNKANQEVNKLEKGATPSSQTQGAAPNKNKLSANVTRTVLVKLHDDEAFDYSENCIDLGSSLDQATFILQKTNDAESRCYSYKNGVRTPIACPTREGCKETSLPQCSFSKLKTPDEEEMKKYVTFQTKTLAQPKMPEEAIKMAEAYMTPAEKAEFEKSQKEAAKKGDITYVSGSTINFNGKSYGPLTQISKFFLSPDSKNFYAEVSEEKQPGFKIITSASSAVLKSSIPVSDLFASPDNSEFAVYQMTMEQKYLITTSKGKTYPVSDPMSFRGAWYSPAGNHIITYFQNALYLDGVLVKSLNEKENYQPCDLYISSDGKGVTTIKDDHTVSFADGDYFEYPLKIVIVNVGGKPYYKWMALENKDLVVYQKPY